MCVASPDPGPAPCPCLGPAWLEVHDGTGVRAVALTGDRVTVGRDARCSVMVSDPAVSRTHVVLERVAGGWWLTDVSTNGTWVEGRRVVHGTLVSEGSTVRMADARLVLREPAGRDPAARTRLLALGASSDLTRSRPGSSHGLSARERQALVELCRPLTTGARFVAPGRVPDIARQLFVSEQRVQVLLAGASRKLGLTGPVDRVALANTALQVGAVTDSDLAEGRPAAP